MTTPSFSIQRTFGGGRLLVCVVVSLTERGLLLAAYTRSLRESGMFWGSRYLNTVCGHARLVLPKVNQEWFPVAMMRP